MSPARRRACVEHVVTRLGVSERIACRVLGQHRSTQRKVARTADDEAALTADVIELGTALRPLRLPPDHGPAARCRLAREPQAGRADWRQEGLKVQATSTGTATGTCSSGRGGYAMTVGPGLRTRCSPQAGDPSAIG